MRLKRPPPNHEHASFIALAVLTIVVLGLVALMRSVKIPLPENIDSTQLHIELEHLVVVPEAIPVGFQIVMYNVKFGPGKTTFSNIANNPDVVYLKKALNHYKQLSNKRVIIYLLDFLIDNKIT